MYPSFPYTSNDIETTEGNSGNGTLNEEDPAHYNDNKDQSKNEYFIPAVEGDSSDTHNNNDPSLVELLENEIEDDLLEACITVFK